MRSKYKGKCSTCGSQFNAGAEITFAAGRGVIACPDCDASLAAQDAPGQDIGGASTNPGSTELRCRIDKLRFSKPDGSWIVADATLDLSDGVALGRDDSLDSSSSTSTSSMPTLRNNAFTVVGPLGQIRQGDVVSVIGTWITDPKFGLQFKSSTMASLAVTESEAGLKAFLCRFLPNIGPRRAEEIIREFGGRDSVYRILEHEPATLMTIQGITEERALEIQQAFVDAGGFREVAQFSAELGLTESMTAKMVEKWGTDAKKVVLEDPYQLMGLDRVGFKMADEVAKKLRIAGGDPRRSAAATQYLLECSTDDGHTWTTVDHLMRDVESDLKETGLTREQIEAGIVTLSQPRVIRKKGKEINVPPKVTVGSDGKVYLSSIEQAERVIAEKILKMLGLDTVIAVVAVAQPQTNLDVSSVTEVTPATSKSTPDEGSDEPNVDVELLMGAF